MTGNIVAPSRHEVERDRHMPAVSAPPAAKEERVLNDDASGGLDDGNRRVNVVINVTVAQVRAPEI